MELSKIIPYGLIVFAGYGRQFLNIISIFLNEVSMKYCDYSPVV